MTYKKNETISNNSDNFHIVIFYACNCCMGVSVRQDDRQLTAQTAFLNIF